MLSFEYPWQCTIQGFKLNLAVQLHENSFIASLKKFESVAKGWVPEQFKSTKEKLQYILLLSKILLEIDIFRKIHWL